MARLLNTRTAQNLYVTVKTVFLDDTETERKFTVGDIVEDLRYAENGEIQTVSGKVTAINYAMNSKLTWNKNKPADTIATDMILKNIVIDTSEQYAASSVTIPCEEILEDEGVENVKMIRYTPQIKFEMWMYYSNRSNSYASIEIGDSFDNVRIINANKIGYDNDYVGSYKVIGMAYKTVSGKVVVTGIAFQNVADSSIVVADIDKILTLNEVYTYSSDNLEQLLNDISAAQDGDTIAITGEISATENPITFNGKNLVFDISGTVESDSNNGINFSEGEYIVNGGGTVKTTTPYDANHGSSTIYVREDAKVTINNMNLEAVVGETIQDQINQGQFGLSVVDNGDLTINGGTYRAGWYAVSTIGNRTNENSVVTINGGEFISTADYALYKPDPSMNWVINGGTINGAAGALCINNGAVLINGGTFTTTGDGNTGTTDNGTGNLANACICIGAKYGECKLRIVDGKFIAPEDGELFEVTDRNPSTIEIFGGKFSAAVPEEYVAEGYACSSEPGEDGMYFVYRLDGEEVPLPVWP